MAVMTTKEKRMLKHANPANKAVRLDERLANMDDDGTYKKDEMVMGLVVDVTVAEINAGHTIVTAPTGRQFQLIDVKAVACGGAVGTTTTVDLLAGATKLATYAQANLTQSTLLDMTDTGVTTLADGASFTAQTAGQDITVGKTGGAADTATGVRFILSYILA